MVSKKAEGIGRHIAVERQLCGNIYVRPLMAD
jgi:hypothetical protein